MKRLHYSNDRLITKPEQLPDSRQLENELKRARKRRSSNRLVLGLIFSLITVSAVAVLAFFRGDAIAIVKSKKGK